MNLTRNYTVNPLDGRLGAGIWDWGQEYMRNAKGRLCPSGGIGINNLLLQYCPLGELVSVDLEIEDWR